MMFECKLISDEGYIAELFYRSGDNAKEVKEGLEMFQWKTKGKWVIELMEGYSEEDVKNLLG